MSRMSSSSPYAALFPQMDPELCSILSTQKQPKQYPPDRSNIALARKGFKAQTARWHRHPVMTNALENCKKEQPWSEHMLTIPVRDGYAMPAKVYRPVNPGNTAVKLPIILLIHGGGYCLGGLDTDEFICQYLCSRVNALVINIDYRLNPENLYPVPILDAYDAAAWIQVNAGVLGSGVEDGDPGKGFLGCGVSGGGNILGAAMWLAAEERRKPNSKGEVPKLTSVMMLMTGWPLQGHDKVNNVTVNLYPGLCPSWSELQDAPIVNLNTMPNYIDMGQVYELTSPMYSLLNLSPDSPALDEFAGRWYHQLGGLDMWRDSARLWFSIFLHGKAELLDLNAKVFAPSVSQRPQVKIDHYPGLPHAWWSVFPQVSRTQQWMEDMVEGAKWALDIDMVGTSQGSRESKL